MLPTTLLHLLPLLLLPLSHAQDQCNLLPVQIAPLPLYSLVPHTLNKTTTTLCSKYTPANTTQYTWVTRLVNLAFTGDYVPLPDLWPVDPNGTYQASGILDPNAIYRDPCFTVTPINLVPYFNGTYKSTNRGGHAVAMNFLDGGGLAALRSNLPAFSPKTNQHRLLTHLYQYIGIILGCDDPEFPRYEGSASQAQVHRFMDLKGPEMHYFIHNIYDAAVSLGVAGPDLVTHVGDAISIGIALDNVFNKKCSPRQKIAAYQGAELQSMCGDDATCARWAFPNATCDAYNQSGFGVPPALAGAAGSDDDRQWKP
ncbi:hypothetical protein ACLMJK_002567 [Lecanora helva]